MGEVVFLKWRPFSKWRYIPCQDLRYKAKCICFQSIYIGKGRTTLLLIHIITNIIANGRQSGDNKGLCARFG